MSMEDVFEDAPQPIVEEKPIEKPVETPVEVKAEPVVEKVEQVVETKPEPPKEPELTDKEKAFYRQAKEETRKRQEIEAKLAALEAKIPKDQPTEKPKEFWEDPEGTLNNYREEMKKLMVTAKIDTSEVMARQKYQDFDENVQVFADILRNTPGLQQQWVNSNNPAEFAYWTGKNFSDLQKAGNIDNLKAQIEKETRVKIEAEYKAKEDAKRKELDNLPPSLSDVRSTGSNKLVWNGPPSLDDVLH